MSQPRIEQESFENCDYSEQRLPRATYDECNFVNCNFSDSSLSGITFVACKFENCNFSMAKFGDTALRDVRFNNCKLMGLHFEHCNPLLLEIAFDNCLLNFSAFYQLPLPNTTFKNCSLQEVDFTEADLTAATFSNCDLHKALFEKTVLEQADLRSAYNFSIDPEINRIKKAKFSTSNIIGLLGKYNIEIE